MGLFMAPLRAQCTLVADIRPGSTNSGSSPRWGHTVGSQMFFVPTTDLGSELWLTDGTAGGTVLVKDIDPGSGSGVAYFEAKPLGQRLVFVGQDPATGPEPWVSDGTPMGTVMLADLRTGPEGSDPRVILEAMGRVFFMAEPVDGVRELWSTDGTPGGTFAHTTSTGAPISTVAMAELGGEVFFFGYTAAHGTELWKTDGTPGGTTIALELAPGPTSGFEPSGLVAFAGRLWFTNRTPAAGTELWSSDGTAAGTSMFIDIVIGAGSSSPAQLTVAGNDLFFVPRDFGGVGTELWKTDGTLANTGVVLDIAPGTSSSFPSRLTAAGGQLYFTVFDDPWVSDGTAVGTLALLPGSDATREFVTLGSEVLFISTADPTCAGGGLELFATDGTPGGTRQVIDLNPGYEDGVERLLGVLGGRMMFVGHDGFTGMELWDTDGTPAGTRLIADLSPESPLSTDPSLEDAAFALGDQLLFVADDGLVGQEIWITDGTAAGTRLLMDMLPGCFGQFGSPPVRWVGQIRDRAIFFARSAVLATNSMWATDGTTAGTVQIGTASGPFRSTGGSTEFAGGLVFFARSSSGRDGLWGTDGTTAGTRLIQDDLTQLGERFAQIGNALVFSADDSNTGAELWRTDGTTAGTQQIIDLVSGRSGSRPEELTTVGNEVFFRASDGVAGLELWASDGTAAGTRLVADIRIGPSSSSPSNLAALDDFVYFFADDGVLGEELWRSDGTAAGTTLVTELIRGPTSADPDHLVSIGGRLFFVADDGRSGPELWTSDGTASGTRLVADVTPGFVGSADGPVQQVGDGQVVTFTSLYQNQRVVYVSDGTPAGTRQVCSGELTRSRISFAGRTGYFSLLDFTLGTELFKIDIAILEGALANRYGESCMGASGQLPSISALTAPTLAASGFGVNVVNAGANTPAALALGTGRGALPVGSCTLLVQSVVLFLPAMTDSEGKATTPLPIPANPAFLGVTLNLQYLIADLASTSPVPIVLSDGLEMIIGR